MNESVFQIAEHPFTLMIFGASGSLAKLKLFPALYELAKEDRLPEDFSIVGFSRTEMSDQAFRDFFCDSVRENEENVKEEVLQKISQHLFYLSADYSSPASYETLLQKIESTEKKASRVRMAYFSVPPSVFPKIFEGLSQVNFGTSLSKLRLIIEKPFGYNFSSAKELKEQIEQKFSSDQIYLLDHYLGKEGVSNLLSLRYANPVLMHLLDKEKVANVQIVALEDRDIEGRANYFDNVGIMRDMIQSHLLQIAAYFLMDLPLEHTAEAIYREKVKILDSLRFPEKDEKEWIVRGQYKGYRETPRVPKDSQTETFAALKLYSMHERWQGTPLYFKSGKALAKKWTAVVIEFKPQTEEKLPPNRLVIQLQPYEKIEFHLLTKLGGKTFDFHELTTGRPIFCSGDCVSEHARLLLEVISGKQSLFLHFEEIFAAWKVIDPLQNYCQTMQSACSLLQLYEKSSMGPSAADDLLTRDGFSWFYSVT